MSDCIGRGCLRERTRSEFAAIREERDRLAAEVRDLTAQNSALWDSANDRNQALQRAEAELSAARARLDAWARLEWALNGPFSPMWQETVRFLGDQYTGHDRDRAGPSAGERHAEKT